ncbi:MAG: phytanoyl-CoA dioxygenase family protein [Actinomycetota bacterium]
MHGDPLRTEFASVGAILQRSLLSESWCGRLRQSIDRCRDDPSPHYAALSPAGLPVVDSDLFRWRDDRNLHELTHSSPLVELAARLLDCDEVVLVEDQWFASAPGANTPSPWHQDQPYYRLDRPFVTIWVTLDDVPRTASLRVVPGSHSTGTTYAPVEFSANSATIDGDSGLAPVPDIDTDPSNFDVRSWSLQAGDAIALDSRALHATGTSPLDRPFRRISTRWATPATRYVVDVPGAARFWEMLPHDRSHRDLLACEMFPRVRPAAAS